MALFVLNDWARDLDDALRPSRIPDQHFGLALTPDDLLSPLMLPYHRPRPQNRNYCRPWIVDRSDTGSTVHNDKDKFQVNLDVQQFKPEEIQVKVVDNSVVVEGKHEEKQDEHGYIARQFTRRYVLPKQCQMENVASSLSSDGVLTITAPKVSALEGAPERFIPITPTGPHKAIKQQQADGDKKEEKKN